MNDLEQLEQMLAAHGDDGGDNEALPSGFREKLDALRAAGAGSPQLAAERASHLKTATWLIGQLDSADNAVVKMQKRRVIRAELNAVKLLDAV